MLIRDIIPPKIKKLKPIPPAILILALILQIVGGVLFLPPIEEAQADGENWLTGWNYRRPITITNPQTDFQTKVEIQGTDSEGANYVDFGKVLTDGADIRFTNSGGSSELYYWIENWNDGSGSEAATIWVRTDATTATPMYMYYGNSVSTTSNGTNTFEFFDDFEDEYIVDWDYSSLGFCCKANPVYIADIDNNGEKEIILTDAGSNEGTNRIVVLNHNGTQRWAYNGEDAAVEPPWDALALADVNEDGFQEIIFVSDKVYVLDKDGNEVWTYDLNLSCAGVTASDIDGDGHVEVVVMFERAAGGYVEIIDYQGNQKHRYNATGTLDHYTCGHTIQAFPLDPGSSHKYIVFADVGHANTLKVLKSDATLQFSYAPGTDDDWDWFDYGHLNEGIETYQVVGIFSGGRLSVLNLNGTVYWEKTDLSHPQNVQVADLDNDGHLEVGVWEKFSYRVKVYNHTGTILYNYDTGIDKGTISAVKRDDGKYYFVAGSCYFDIDGYIDNLSCERVVLNLKQRTKDHNFNLDFNGDGADDLLTGYGIAKLIEEVKWTYPELSPTIENSYMKLVGGATGAGSQRAVSNPSFSTDRSLRLKAKIVSEASTLLFGWVDEYDVHQEVAWHRTGSTEETATRHGGTEEDNTYDYLLDEKIYDIHRNSSTSVIFKRDDTTLFTHITQIPTGDLKAYIYTANGDEIWIDWILVRKYAATEPSASVGAEEEGNTAPSATFDNDFSTWQSGDITVNYNLIDAESDTCNISQTASSGIEYSTDNATWFDATEGTGGDGMTGLTSSASPGTDHSFVWASATDLADIEDSTVWLRIRPNDGTVDADAWVSSNSFGVDNIAPTITPVLNDTDGYVNSAETSTGIDILITTTGVEDGLTVTCNIKDVGDAHTVGPVTGDITSNAVTIASTALTTLDDGTITVSCDVSDAAGNPAPQGSDTSVKDVLAPSNIGVFSITANSSSQLTITTQTALDTGSGLNTAPYWFQETSGNTGASSSSEWQTLTEFIDDGLSSNTQYTYQVKAKDTAGNESGYSDSSSKYTLSCGGGGGGLPPAAYNPPASPSPSPQNPQGEFKVLINDNAEYANNLEVSLTLLAGKDTKRMAISNFSDFRNASQIPYQKEIEWNLCSSDLCLEGEYTVYVKFYTQWGQRSEIVSDNIIYRKEVPKPPEIEKPEKEPEIIEPSIEEPEIEKPEVPEEPEEPEEKKIPSGELPSALEQLPEYIKEIAQKFSPIKDIFV
ncbi:DUF2341 domain-containing protein, partial [Candidatus Parcubacteria bacterium]|nr:DUF2341 domain-containing protein [Candidatus Parcubacteria bacterium]